jgi:hypothetical protein
MDGKPLQLLADVRSKINTITDQAERIDNEYIRKDKQFPHFCILIIIVHHLYTIRIYIVDLLSFLSIFDYLSALI